MNPREKVNLYKSSDSEADTKPAAKTKKTLLSSIFATKNKKAREVSDNGNEEEEEVVPPYCQPNHKPFPPIEELQDRRYWAKLQTINAAINDPNTGQDQLNQIVDLILETGNFSTSPDRFNFDICNLEKSVVHQIAE